MRVRISAEGTVSAYEYDAAGNQIKVTDFLSQTNVAGLAAGQSPDYYLAKVTPDAANDRVTRNV
jgi:YD repeat-containing protein